MWIPVNSINKVFCRRARNIVLNSTCIKKQLVFWPSGKSNHYKADAIDFNAILTVEKKKKEKRITSTIYIYGLSNRFRVSNLFQLILGK